MAYETLSNGFVSHSDKANCQIGADTPGSFCDNAVDKCFSTVRTFIGSRCDGTNNQTGMPPLRFQKANLR